MTDSSSWVCISTTPPGEVTPTVFVFVFSHVVFCRTVSCYFFQSSVGTSTSTAIRSLWIRLRESGSTISTSRRQVDRGRICPVWHYVCIHRHFWSQRLVVINRLKLPENLHIYSSLYRVPAPDEICDNKHLLYPGRSVSF